MVISHMKIVIAVTCVTLMSMRAIGFSPQPSSSGLPTFGYEVVRLWERPVEELLAGPTALLPLAPLGSVIGARGPPQPRHRADQREHEDPAQREEQVHDRIPRSNRSVMAPANSGTVHGFGVRAHIDY